MNLPIRTRFLLFGYIARRAASLYWAEALASFAAAAAIRFSDKIAPAIVGWASFSCGLGAGLFLCGAFCARIFRRNSSVFQFKAQVLHGECIRTVVPFFERMAVKSVLLCAVSLSLLRGNDPQSVLFHAELALWAALGAHTLASVRAGWKIIRTLLLWQTV